MKKALRGRDEFRRRGHGNAYNKFGCSEVNRPKYKRLKLNALQ